jgi:type IV secretory pathway VirB9-like protein
MRTWKRRHKKYKANKSTRTHVTKEHNNRNTNNTLIKTRGVSHCDVAIYIEKLSYDKRRIMKTQIFHHIKNTIFQKTSKRNQNPSRYYNTL